MSEPATPRLHTSPDTAPPADPGPADPPPPVYGVGGKRLITRLQLYGLLAVGEATGGRLRAAGKIGPRPIWAGSSLRYLLSEATAWVSTPAEGGDAAPRASRPPGRHPVRDEGVAAVGALEAGVEQEEGGPGQGSLPAGRAAGVEHRQVLLVRLRDRLGGLLPAERSLRQGRVRPRRRVGRGDCRSPGAGELHPAAAALGRLATYAEVSPSGTGVKAFLRGQLPAGCGHRAAGRTPGPAPERPHRGGPGLTRPTTSRASFAGTRAGRTMGQSPMGWAVLSVKQCAERVGVCETIVRRWVRAGLLPYYRLGTPGRRGKIAVEPDDPDALLASLKVTKKGPEPAEAPAARPKSAFTHLRLS